VTLLVPERWPERAGQMVEAERPVLPNFRYITRRTAFTGFYYIYFFAGLSRLLLRLRPDVIYCYEEPHTLLSALTLLYRRLFLPRTRVVLYAAQNIRKRYPFPFRLFERYCFDRADAILPCGTRVAQTLRSKGYTGLLHIVPLPVDTATFAPGPKLREAGRRLLGVKDDDFLIGYTGKLVEEKGLAALLDAFAIVSARLPGARLVLVGAGPMAASLEATVRSKGLDGRVLMPGVVHNSELPTYLNAMDAFVLPSETRPNWREQFGRAIVEAMACGVASIGSDSGEIPAVVADAGMTFREGDAAALAGCLLTLDGNPALRARLGRAGRERVLRLFSVEKVAAQHLAIYRRFGEPSRGKP
jgi:glycosyltransferase involved in cell wall biosynthesis